MDVSYSYPVGFGYLGVGACERRGGMVRRSVGSLLALSFARRGLYVRGRRAFRSLGASRFFQVVSCALSSVVPLRLPTLCIRTCLFQGSLVGVGPCSGLRLRRQPRFSCVLPLHQLPCIRCVPSIRARSRLLRGLDWSSFLPIHPWIHLHVASGRCRTLSSWPGGVGTPACPPLHR